MKFKIGDRVIWDDRIGTIKYIVDELNYGIKFDNWYNGHGGNRSGIAQFEPHSKQYWNLFEDNLILDINYIKLKKLEGIQ